MKSPLNLMHDTLIDAAIKGKRDRAHAWIVTPQFFEAFVDDLRERITNYIGEHDLPVGTVRKYHGIPIVIDETAEHFEDGFKLELFPPERIEDTALRRVGALVGLLEKLAEEVGALRSKLFELEHKDDSVHST